MKNFAFFLIFISFFASCSKPSANVSYVTESFGVSGNCNMCKSKIEKAISVPGIKNAVWNMQTKILTVQYAPSKISIDAIHQKIADAGYDTDKIRAKDDVYENLHTCCKYERK